MKQVEQDSTPANTSPNSKQVEGTGTGTPVRKRNRRRRLAAW
ncbi:hypothetical protein [Bdellovibrio svalbardensis]|uniref:Uncharacterized protein n=1 Tax=Bdellovibrio svalbardensis TaxID=2972972 RepID=A0ABT6DKH8_9BACT|nr:hypothetical protein [Bdellovibrio svalbardensis]MDG0815613.1 hypothetical protein [Bdellovibrio svalbardensis]